MKKHNMRKTLFSILILAIILTNCEDENNDTDKENGNDKEQAYLTITYHAYSDDYPEKEFVTGEPPVDPKHYKPPVWNNKNFTLEFNDTAIVLDRGTLEHKKGKEFLGWHNPKNYYTYQPEEEIKVMDNIDLYPQWHY